MAKRLTGKPHSAWSGKLRESGLMFTLVGLLAGFVLGWQCKNKEAREQAATVAVSALVGLGFGIFIDKLLPQWKKMEFSDINVTLPGGGPGFRICARGCDKAAAWQLFVEMSTRIAFQKLPDGHGSNREALTSLYNLFLAIRDILKTTGPSTAKAGTGIDETAMRILNSELRPFLTKWHTILSQHEKSGAEFWAGEKEFRSELEKLRQRLLVYADAIGQAADIRNVSNLLPQDRPADI